MDILTALRNSKKGQLKYDRTWAEEGRTKEILDEISSSLKKLTISPKSLTLLQAESHVSHNKNEKQLLLEENDLSNEEPSKNVRKKYEDFIVAHYYQHQSEMELPLIEYEVERMKSIQDAFNAKKAEFENYSEELLQQAEQEYHLLKRKHELDAKKRTMVLLKLEETLIKEAKEKETLQREHYQSHAKMLSAKISEAEKKQKQAEEELKKKKQEQEEINLQLKNCQKEGQKLIEKSIEKIISFEHQNFLNIPTSEYLNKLAKLLNDINIYYDNAQTLALTIEDVLHVNLLVEKACEYHQEIINDIEQAKLKAFHELEKQSLHKNLVKDSNKVASKTAPNVSRITTKDKNITKKESNDKSSGIKEILSSVIAPDAIDDYYKVKEILKEVQDTIQPFIDNPQNKKIRFQMQKAINVPINAISSSSGSHVKDKIKRLLALLSGKTVEVSGKYVSCKDITTQKYCMNLLAKQFVEQSDRQVSAQHSTAFPIAMAIVGVWANKPEVGPLILAHFYSQCPYLVPYYPPKEDNQSDMEYYKSLGYRYDENGNIEKQDKFLSRMSGYTHLYAAIIQSPLPPDCKTNHPHGITWGWKWLSRMLNLDPRPDITATLLYDFLEVTGYALQKSYNKQFKKILHILCKDYFQKIKRITPTGSGGPVDRLETFLQQTIKRSYISSPEGVLTSSFWNR